jgi:trimeric autotransporter adhesin
MTQAILLAGLTLKVSFRGCSPETCASRFFVLDKVARFFRNFRPMKIMDSLPITLIVLCFAVLPLANAVVPAPDGGYPGGNTAEGQSALFSLTTGGFNTAIGFLSLRSDASGGFNTAVGAGTLLANTGGTNTATGVGALLSNTIGFSNTANGAFALFNNTTASSNTATGAYALYSNDGGGENVATGGGALSNSTTGSNNIALGFNAGTNITTANNVICIGAEGEDVSNSCYIGHIFGVTSAGGTGVLINSDGRLGTTTSSKRFKEDIQPMDKASAALYTLKPVTFRYKKEIDPAGTSQLGLVAEDVEKVNPALVVRDKEGKPYSVRYEQVNAMLLNEFLKEHRAFVEEQRKLEDQQKEIDSLKAELKEQKSLIQKVSDKIEVRQATTRVAGREP